MTIGQIEKGFKSDSWKGFNIIESSNEETHLNDYEEDDFIIHMDKTGRITRYTLVGMSKSGKKIGVGMMEMSFDIK